MNEPEMDIPTLIKAIEKYGFQCEAGSLTNCLEWQRLKQHLAERERDQPAASIH